MNFTSLLSRATYSLHHELTRELSTSYKMDFVTSEKENPKIKDLENHAD